jgi:16S rRNA (adenine1518-N6/adenine1519-N6)-dimethyltransferase
MKQHPRTLGQVFLHDANIVQKILRFANPLPGNRIIEIGCGKGILTRALAAVGPTTVIEIDARWIAYVTDLELPGVTYLHADATRVDYGQFPLGSPIIANIPYHITSPLLVAFAQYRNHLGPITIMIQKEMATRLLAEPGTKAYGAMTLFCHYHFTVHNGFEVSRRCFWPVPSVDSQVITLQPKAAALSESDEALFFGMTRTFFWGRRKKMITCLKNSPYIRLTSPLPDACLAALNHRAESASLSALLALFSTLRHHMAFKEGCPL